MSKKYKFSSNDKLHFVTFTITNWIDLFIRNEYRDILIESIQFCQKEKDLDVYGWCILPSHVHLIIGTPLAQICSIALSDGVSLPFMNKSQMISIE